MINSLTRFIPEWMQELNVSCAGVVIIDQQAIVYREGFGDYDGSPMRPDTVISAQSLTKPIVAYLTLEMMQSGQIDLDKPLYDYLEKSYLVDDPHVDAITARQALSHSAGFPNWREHSGLSLLFDPGTDFHYSGEGYCYLQTTLEAIQNDSLENLLKPLFNEVSMSNSYMAVYTQEMREHWLFSQFEHLNTNAAFSLMTSAEDYAQFMLAMLNQANQAITEIMLAPQQGVAGKDGFYWGNGWGIEDTSRCRYFWQWGQGPQEQHLAIGCMDKQWAAIIMTNENQNDSNGLTLAHKIVQHYDVEVSKWFDWLSE